MQQSIVFFLGIVARLGIGLFDMMYREAHRLTDTILHNGKLDKLYGFPKEIHTGWEMEMRFYDLGNKSQPSCSHMSNI